MAWLLPLDKQTYQPFWPGYYPWTDKPFQTFFHEYYTPEQVDIENVLVWILPRFRQTSKSGAALTGGAATHLVYLFYWPLDYQKVNFRFLTWTYSPNRERVSYTQLSGQQLCVTDSNSYWSVAITIGQPAPTALVNHPCQQQYRPRMESRNSLRRNCLCRNGPFKELSLQELDIQLIVVQGTVFYRNGR